LNNILIYYFIFTRYVRIYNEAHEVSSSRRASGRQSYYNNNNNNNIVSSYTLYYNTFILYSWCYEMCFTENNPFTYHTNPQVCLRVPRINNNNNNNIYYINTISEIIKTVVLGFSVFVYLQTFTNINLHKQLIFKSL